MLYHCLQGGTLDVGARKIGILRRDREVAKKEVRKKRFFLVLFASLPLFASLALFVADWKKQGTPDLRRGLLPLFRTLHRLQTCATFGTSALRTFALLPPARGTCLRQNPRALRFFVALLPAAGLSCSIRQTERKTG